MDRSRLRFMLAGPFAVLCATNAPVPASSPVFASSPGEAVEPAARSAAVWRPDDGADAGCAAQAGRVSDSAGMEPYAAGLVLGAHNAERRLLGLPPLAWSCRLEQEAARWARVLVRQGRLEHASAAARGGSGENLWMGTAGRWEVAHMVGRFIEEKRHYRHGRFPDISHTGDWADVGHYSQVVWRDTRELGCALAHGAASDVLVCRYHPGGNVRGRMAY